jgi:hypothetical protein
MKIGVVRNIAGNIEALRDTDRQFDALGVDAKACLGQIVGIYPHVDECVELISSRGYHSLKQIIEEEFVDGCVFRGWSKFHLVDAVRFTRNRASTSTLDYLKHLPKHLAIGDTGFEGLAGGDGYLYTPQQVAAAFGEWKQRVVIHAAESDPYVWREDLNRTGLTIGRNQLHSVDRLLISTGGAGSFYEGSLNTREPSAMVFDDKDRTVDLFRPKCDIQKLFEQLRAMGYPKGSLGFLEKHEYEMWKSGGH